MNRKFFTGLAVVALLCVGSTLGAQNPDYTLAVDGPAQAGENASFGAAVLLSFPNGMDMAGWSFGVCSDPAAVQFDSEADGATTVTVKNGAAPDFNEKAMFPDGFTVGLVICFTGCAVLPPGSGYELNTMQYTALVETPSTVINFCDTLGNPPVATVVVVNGASIIPVQDGLDLEVVGVPDPAFDYIAPDASTNYSPMDGLWSTDLLIQIDQNNDGTAPLAETQGFSMGLGHDSAQVEVTAVTESPLGMAVDFAEVSLLADGWTIGVVYSFTGAFTIPFANPTDVIQVSYQNAAGAPLNGDMTGTTTPLIWSNGLGTPNVANVVVVGGASLNANFVDGSILLNPVTTAEFVNGDANQDSIVNIADGIWIINALFQSGPMFDCDLANDSNDDGLLDASDAVYIWNYRFMGGPAPAAPFPTCGTVPNQMPADCNSYNSCP